MNNILVTGSKGQLGSEIVVIASQFPDYNFIFTDVDELDLTQSKELEVFFNENTVSVCINCAAYTAVDKAEDERELAMLINYESVENLAKVCNANNTLLIQISTDYIFNGKQYRPYLETDVPDPDSYYGLTKLKGEQAVLEIANRVIVIRTSWLYSSFGNNFVKTMMKLGRERDELGVVVDQIGTPTYAADLAITIMTIIQKTSNSPIKEIYNYSNEGAISWYDFAKEIMNHAKINCRIKAIESKDFPAKANRPY